MKVTNLRTTEYNEFYAGYIGKVPKNWTLKKGFDLGKTEVVAFFKAIPNDKLEYRYAENKWTVKEVFQHIIDTERVMGYRCFRMARHDATAMAGFEQDDYIKPSKANQKSMDILVNEYLSVRQSTNALIQSLSNEDLEFVGNANGAAMSARAVAFMILGHEIWHIDIIKALYL